MTDLELAYAELQIAIADYNTYGGDRRYLEGLAEAVRAAEAHERLASAKRSSLAPFI